MPEFAAGSGFDAARLLLLIASLVAAVALVWSAWVGWGQFEAFVQGRGTFLSMALFTGRAIVVLLLLLFFIR